MRITKDQAQVWVYKPTKKDKPIKAIFKGWLYRPVCYLHYKCGNYFTEENEKHDCQHWSIAFQNKMKGYINEISKYK